MKDLTIGMIASHCCIRVQKMALPLMALGHKVHLAANRLPPFWEQYTTVSLCEGPDQYEAAIKLMEPAVDIFHVHNEPSWFVTLLKEITDKPVLLDVHDTYLTRTTHKQWQAKADAGEFYPRVWIEERNNFQLADALNFVSEDVRRVVVDEFAIEAPTHVLPSYVMRGMYQYKGVGWLGGLVYEGKVTLPGENTGSNEGFRYCDYTDIARDCDRIGMDFHLYPGKAKHALTKHFEQFKTTHLHQPYRYDELLREITAHDWGLVGNAFHTPQWEKTAPNKLFEYMAAGIPVVAMNAKWCEDFIQETGVGIVVGSIDELADRWSEHRRIRDTVVRERAHWSMEAHIGGLVDFYRGVIDGR